MPVSLDKPSQPIPANKRASDFPPAVCTVNVSPFHAIAELANAPKRERLRLAKAAERARIEARSNPSPDSAHAASVRAATALVSHLAFGATVQRNADYRGTSPEFDGSSRDKRGQR